MKIRCLLVPRLNEWEGRAVGDLKVIGFSNIPEVLDFLRRYDSSAFRPEMPSPLLNRYEEDMSDIHGQESVKGRRK